MASPTTYKGLTILEGASGTAGQALTNNFKAIADELDTAAAPAGVDTNVQYNNGGVLGGATALTYDDATGNVVLTTGNLTLTLGDVLVPAGDVTVTLGDIDILAGELSVAAGQRVTIDGAGGNDYITLNAATWEFWYSGAVGFRIEAE